jgi:cell wall-associated NlpC family hydrolase
MITGAMVAEAARQYVGSPIVERGRSREGLDCVGLVVCTARDLGLRFPDFQGYGLNVWQHPKLRDVRASMSQYMREVTGAFAVGDIVLFGLGRSAIALSVGIVTAVNKGAIQKMIGGLHEEGNYFAEYDFIEGRYAIAGCYRFRELIATRW